MALLVAATVASAVYTCVVLCSVPEPQGPKSSTVVATLVDPGVDVSDDVEVFTKAAKTSTSVIAVLMPTPVAGSDAPVSDSSTRKTLVSVRRRSDAGVIDVSSQYASTYASLPSGLLVIA